MSAVPAVKLVSGQVRRAGCHLPGFCFALAVLLTSCQDSRLSPNYANPIRASGLMPGLDEVALPNLPGDLDLRPHNLALTEWGTITVWVRGQGDSHLMSLDSTGKVLAVWGRLGEGPGEVRNADLLLSGDSLVALAGISGEPVRVFTPRGRLVIQKSRAPVGLPSALAQGTILWWTGRHLGQGPRDTGATVVREGPVVRWCVFVDCDEIILKPHDPIVDTINQHAPPAEQGLWPALASRGDVSVVGEGYGYKLWEINHASGSVSGEFGRRLAPRMATDSQIAEAEATWARAERGVPGPGGKLVRENFDREREFLRNEPLPHFQYMGLAFDGKGRLWVVGRESNGAMFLDVFSDSTFLGRVTVNCNRTSYAATVRGHWLATICQVDDAENRFKVRMFRIVEPDSSIQNNSAT